MPELPEVEIVRRGLEPAVKNKAITSVDVWRKKLRIPIPVNFKAILEGKKVVRTLRRGKYILIFLEDGNGFAIHLGMSGRIKIAKPGKPVMREKHDHWRIRMEDGTEIFYNDARRFGMAFLVTAADWEQKKYFSGMGAEPFDSSFSADALHRNLGKRKTPVKAALLDQRVIAGVGNIYACESLFEAGIHPLTSSRQISKAQAKKLFVAILSVLERAITAGGSSLRDYRQADGSLGYFQHNFSVYDREGAACGQCACDILKTGGVRRIVQTGRSTFYCPRKQK